jgi:hypothetical protein
MVANICATIGVVVGWIESPNVILNFSRRARTSGPEPVPLSGMAES